MKYVVIGAVAGGMTAAMKIRRNDDKAEIIVYDKDTDISYSGCSLAYYISGVIDNRKNIVPRDSQYFKKFNVDVKTDHEVLKVDVQNKKVIVKDLKTGNIFEDGFDKLIIATGAHPVIPQIEGIELEGIFVLRNVKDADRIKEFINNNLPKKALIVGGGYIGLEMAEALKVLGMDVCIVEKQKNILPNLDSDMARLVESYLEENGVVIRKGTSVLRFEGDKRVKRAILSDGSKIEADFVLLAVGVRPSTKFLEESGIQLLPNGAIKVDEYMRTNIEGIFAAGDCAAVYFKLNGKTMYVPLGSTANKMGRIAGENATGGSMKFSGVLATSIFKVFDLTVAQTGYTEKMAQEDGIEYEVGHITKPHITTAYPGAEKMTIKALAELSSRKVIGAQIVGTKGVDKRIDVLATAIFAGLTTDDLFQLDLAYAPPFSSAKDPIHYVGMVMSNFLDKRKFNCTQEKLLEKMQKGEDFIVLDVRTPEQYKAKHIKGAINIPLEMLHEKMNELSREKQIIVYCNSGVSSNIAQNILQQNGFRKVYNLSGGISNVTIKQLIE
ncbi:FAD-dependent pyridine nucleotide-disulfide oxidoreductase [Caldicellulosiruptor kronotskyensis 2002]|uniref:FAD-dependent pyridine nucleotide-disulfide oxidoreductase n=1 Tax=Caldicellulosiruptor kronotskyensis (strain DSM 18902 / VKM B-2412 / 2002) TaxID=632348 RepID=E4SGR8_CALK2|nr:FAD-dependent oxidoreductase [Caldicellulosiruptor kronotskyensis]ADQ46943.1 FAD-dependent pyridine nucleotide-disulfide oxidoreductase [Caldicellulosiruptor kronotskyensis 2002]